MSVSSIGARRVTSKSRVCAKWGDNAVLCPCCHVRRVQNVSRYVDGEGAICEIANGMASGYLTKPSSLANSRADSHSTLLMLSASFAILRLERRTMLR